MAGLMHTSGLWKTWSTLTESVKKGEKTFADPIQKRSPAWFESFIAAMHYRATAGAPAMIAKLDLSKISRVLDVGGGSGAYAMAFVRARKMRLPLQFLISRMLYLSQGNMLCQKGCLTG